MPSLHTLLELVFVMSASATLTDPGTLSNKTKIPWGPCDKSDLAAWGASTAITCANLSVPLDYTNGSSTDKLTLQLVRVPAAIQPSKGTIQFNFGGPGDPARPTLASADTLLRNLTGGAYDLVAFDPRGTGNTIPFVCTSNNVDALSFLQNIQNANDSDTALGRTWAAAQINAQTCAAENNETGSVINTAFVARDLISVVDALGEDGMLRYYGFSYGTTLGATVAAMFPDRIGRLVLDGVQNPHEYYHALADFQEWTRSDKVLFALFSFCVQAGSSACPLAALNMTAIELQDAYWNFLGSVRERPLVVDGTLQGYGEIKGYVSELLYNNADWTNFTAVLAEIFSAPGDAARALEGVLTPSGSGGKSSEPINYVAEVATVQALYGIHCGDRAARTTDFDEFVPAYLELTNITTVFGDVVTEREMTCAQWLIQPKERYEGNFQAQTANPILLVTNDGDAYTPVESAYNVSSGFAGSVVLELTDAYGHSSFNVPSSCALKHISQYWLDGTLPPPGTKCEVEAKPYAGVTWDDVIAKVANNDTAVARRGVQAAGSI